MSFILTYSSTPVLSNLSAFGNVFSAFLSIHPRIILQIIEQIHKKKLSQNPKLSPYFKYIIGYTLSFITFANLETAISIPSAKDSYYPLYHVLTNALSVTLNHYPPNPKINLLPSIIILPHAPLIFTIFVESAKKNSPNPIIEQNSIIPHLFPITLSISIPPLFKYTIMELQNLVHYILYKAYCTKRKLNPCLFTLPPYSTVY